MIPRGLPQGTPIVCVNDEGVRTLHKGKVYRVEGYLGEDLVVLLRPDGRVYPDSCVDRRWYRNRFNVAKSPDGADYQASDDVDLVNN